MIKIPEKTIIQEIQPQCDNLYIALKEQKELQHLTNQDVADITGIPISNVSKFFSGALSQPSVFYVMAICICLKQSLDSLFSNETKPKESTEAEKRIAELEAENKLLKQEISFNKRLIKHLETGIKDLETGIKERKPVIYSLAGLCLITSFALASYLFVDITNPNSGYFQGSHISPFIIVIIIAVAASVAQAIYYSSRRRKYENVEKTEDKEKNNRE